VTSRRRNALVLLLVVGVVSAAAVVISQWPTRLGLDLRGGVELVYEARPTPKVPEVTPQAVDDAIDVIRERTDSLGVAEAEIQRAGSDQISVAIPDVENAERAIQRVGTTAQLQFYDWEPNVVGQLDRPLPGLFEAVQLAGEAKPKAEPEDLPPGGPDPAVVRRLGGDQAKVRERYDRRNDTGGQKLYLFGPDRQLIVGPDSSCESLLSDFEARGPTQRPPLAKPVPKGSECVPQLQALGAAGPPPGSRVLQVPQGIVVVRDERPPNLPPGAPEPPNYFVLEDDSELSGNDITDPKAELDQTINQPVVTMQFTDQGQRAFAEVTRRIAQRGAEIILPPGTSQESAFQRFAITLDNRIVSRATIDFVENPEGIDGRTGAQITGIGNFDETQALAEQLRIGALPIELKLISQTQISATLGQQALDQGLYAGAAGLVLTLLFLVLFYRVLGLVAGLGLVIYAVILYAVVELFSITLTLPGIAGLILTLGVAADANIVIFERIKEEARTGRSIPAAIASGYAKALRTIFDANVVIVGVAFILFTLAIGGVKGFALTLGLGTLISLFTAVLATSAVLGTLSRTRPLRSRFALGASGEGRSTRFDFMGYSKWFFSASGLILVAGALAISGLGLNFGIDFEAGTRIQTPLEQPAQVGEVRAAIAPLGLADAKIQEVEDPEIGENVVQISTLSLGPERVQQVRQVLDERFGVAQADFTTSSVGPTFGAQIARTALIAVIASLLLISVYIGFRFEFKYSVPVLIALAHDLLITAGVYALTGREVTASTVAALLTILGYSLYDTIIVFDRVRENVPRMPRATFSQIVNRSMSEVITRSLVTSLSTLFPVAALMLFGGETLRDFGFALLVGVISGTYSSIFIAAPVLVAWKEREPIYRRRREVVLGDHEGVVPAFAAADLGAGARRPVPGPATGDPQREPIVDAAREIGQATTEAPEESGAGAATIAATAARPNGAAATRSAGAAPADPAAAARERRRAARRASGAPPPGSRPADGPTGDGDGYPGGGAGGAGTKDGGEGSTGGSRGARSSRRRRKHGRR
jgi:SecD/SecF fusion protein